MRMSLSCEELWEEAKTSTKAKVWRWKSKSCASLSFVYVSITQSCPTLCDLVDCSLPGSSVQGILQVRRLEWVAIPFSRGSSWPRDWTRVSRYNAADALPSEPPGNSTFLCPYPNPAHHPGPTSSHLPHEALLIPCSLLILPFILEHSSLECPSGLNSLVR